MILRSLSAATLDPAPWPEPPVYHHTVGLDLGGGAFRTLRLGPDALIISDGRAQIVIPIIELLSITADGKACLPAPPPSPTAP